MRRGRKIIALLVVVIFCQILLAGGDIKNTQVTIYNDDQGLIYQLREVNFEKGMNIIRIEGVSANVRTATVKIRFPKIRSKVNVQEQNFQYDLVSTEKLFQKYIGENVTFRLTNKEAISGKLLNADRNTIIVQLPEGNVRIARTESIADYDFPALPQGLIVKPTLEWKINSNYKGTTDAELSYLTTGMSWNAEYILVLDQDKQPEQSENFTLSSWISLNNNSGATYENARLKLIAGEINKIEDEKRYRAKAKLTDALTVFAEQAVESREIADYYLYELSQPVTLRDQEQKQVSLFDEIQAKGRKVYLFDNYDLNEREDPLNVAFRFENTAENNRGMALPKGVVRMFKRDTDGTLQFIGEDRIDHTSRKDTLRLTIGKAFDVRGVRTIVAREMQTKRSELVTVEIQIINRKNVPVNVEVIDRLAGYWEIKKTSHTFTQKSSRMIVFPLQVNADTTETISYTFQRKL
jgi:hypothetical protein